jgi:hypothetical protein
MIRLRSIVPFIRSRLDARRVRLFGTLYPDRASSRIFPVKQVEIPIVIGSLVAICGSYLVPKLNAAGFIQLGARLVMLFGLLLFALGWRSLLERLLWTRWRSGSPMTVTKAEVDGALQLSYVLTTAAGFSLFANRGSFFAALVFGNVLCGIAVLDSARQLTKEQSSDGGITYAKLNSGVYDFAMGMIKRQVGFTVCALLWLFVREV